jgi:hypothetical protein
MRPQDLLLHRVIVNLGRSFIGLWWPTVSSKGDHESGKDEEEQEWMDRQVEGAAEEVRQ